MAHTSHPNHVVGLKGKLLSSTGLRSFQSAVEMGGNFLISVVIVRRLGSDALGTYLYVGALISIIQSLLKLGLVPTVTREIARESLRRREIASNSLTIFICITIPGTLTVAFLSSWILPVELTVRRLIWLMALASALGSTTGLLQGISQAVGRFGYSLLFVTARKTGLLLVTLLFPFGLGIEGILAGFIGIHVTVLLSAWLLTTSRVTPVGIMFSCPEWKRLIRQSLPLAFSGLTVAANTRADSFILGTVRSVAEVGVYGAAYNIFLGLGGIINSIGMAAFPTLAELAGKSEREAMALAFRIGRLLLVGTILIAVAGSVLSDQIILLIYGPQLLSASRLMGVVFTALIFSSVGKLCQFALISLRLQKYVLSATLAGALVNVGLNLILIPALGYMGAAYTTLITELIVFAISLLFLVNHSRKNNGMPSDFASAQREALPH